MITQSLPSITILGAGAWGTALALHCSRQGYLVYLWSIDPHEITALKQDHANNRYLPGYTLPHTIQPTDCLQTALSPSSHIVLIAVPSVGFRPVLECIQPHLATNIGLIAATKGMDTHTNQLLPDVMTRYTPAQAIALLSGPSFAQEVAAGLPTALVLATRQADAFSVFVHTVSSAKFRIQLCDDLTGVAICNVSKNVLAIAVGMIDGLALGANARSALLTQGFAEIMQLGIAIGGQPATFTGLAGIGDLILTCTDNQSRNRRFGLALGQGASLQTAEQAIGHVVEGKQNALAIMALAKQQRLSLPICDAICQLLTGQLSVQQAAEALFA